MYRYHSLRDFYYYETILYGASSFEELLSMQFPRAGEFHFYGTEQDQRIGIMKSDKPVYYFSVDPDRFNERFGRELRKKEYEIEDYLGNIRLVFSDMKLGNFPLSGDFQVDIISVLNYYPYGMLQPGRIIPIPEAGADGAAEFYRFGFNGMEADHDMKHDMNPVPGTKIGIGNSYTTEFRGNDPRLGKWWSMDPKVNPSVSSYLAYGANPINFVDPRGDTISISYNDIKEVRDYNAFFYDMQEVPEGNILYTSLYYSRIKNTYSFRQGLIVADNGDRTFGAAYSDFYESEGVYKNTRIWVWNPLTVVKDAVYSFDIEMRIMQTIFHESWHAFQHQEFPSFYHKYIYLQEEDYLNDPGEYANTLEGKRIYGKAPLPGAWDKWEEVKDKYAAYYTKKHIKKAVNQVIKAITEPYVKYYNYVIKQPFDNLINSISKGINQYKSKKK